MYYTFKYTNERNTKQSITVRVKAGRYLDAENKADKYASDAMRHTEIVRELLSISD